VEPFLRLIEQRLSSFRIRLGSRLLSMNAGAVGLGSLHLLRLWSFIFSGSGWLSILLGKFMIDAETRAT
jgi:hypothetical protein